MSFRGDRSIEFDGSAMPSIGREPAAGDQAAGRPGATMTERDDLDSDEDLPIEAFRRSRP
jgi:hypothetical protein